MSLLFSVIFDPPSRILRPRRSIIKSQAAVDSLCYPETMNRTLVLNAPVYFSAFWKIVKGFLDKVRLVGGGRGGEEAYTIAGCVCGRTTTETDRLWCVV